ncbi:MAG: prepilin-type N-terminal cleavage/methylation domain-containing protein [Xanthomonadales bacterium]|nr:prepilin-type N-terminal cleavage/methylation domain-containing protein [Xanthomonadales bacterium]
MTSRIRGLTLVELLVTVAIVAIGVSLAVPSMQFIREKRQVVGAAEGIVNLMRLAQGESIKRNEQVNVSWYSPGSHGASWCVGASLPPKSTPCDCVR